MEKLIGLVKKNREAFVTSVKMRIQCFIDNSSLSSIGHVIALSPTSMFKRLFWLATITACCYGSAVILKGALNLYSQDAVSYSVETDYLHWDTPFPAVTICEVQNETRTKSDMLEHNFPSSLVNFGKDISFWKKAFCKTCVNCKMNISCVDDFLPILDVTRSTCDELLTVCSFAGEEFSCCERFKPMATEYGTCFTFNSKHTGEEDGNEIINRKISLPTLKFTANAKVNLKIHSPEERISVLTENILGGCSTLHRGMCFEANIAAEEIISDISVQRLAADSRDCLYKDELPPAAEGWPFEDYSHSACVWYCRTMAQIKICNCSYHFMPKIDNIPVCNIEGLKCLYRYRESLENSNCFCPMSCGEVSYNIVSVSCIKDDKPDVITGSLRVAQLPHLRVRRHAIRDMLGLVVDFGGVVGVFFGASLLSFLEIVYIFCIRKYP